MKLIVNHRSDENYVYKEAVLHCEEKELPFYFQFPKNTEKDLTERADPFVISLIFVMMQLGGGVCEVIGAPLSLSVQKNMTKFSKIWHFWRPDLYSAVTFSATNIQGRETPKNLDTISTFSGGLDSTFINYLIAKNIDNPSNLKIKKSILVHGADIPLSDEVAFHTIRSHIEEMTDDLGIELIPVKTNVKNSFIHWGHAHGSLFVGIMSFFSKTISHAITSDYSYAYFEIPHGFNAFTDKYFSSEEFDFHLGGTDYTRTERAAVIKN